MSQMILEYDEFCMFLLNIEVFNIMTPDFPYTSENETKCTILYFCMFYFHLFNVLLKKVKNDIFHEIDQKGYMSGCLSIVMNPSIKSVGINAQIFSDLRDRFIRI